MKYHIFMMVLVLTCALMDATNYQKVSVGRVQSKQLQLYEIYYQARELLNLLEAVDKDIFCRIDLNMLPIRRGQKWEKKFSGVVNLLKLLVCEN